MANGAFDTGEQKRATTPKHSPAKPVRRSAVEAGLPDAATLDSTVASGQVPLQRQIVELQRTAGNKAVGTYLQRDKLSDLEKRTKVLEKKAEATNLDAKYRSEFGKKTSNYKQIVYRLTGAFQQSTSGFTGAQTEQAAQDAVLDQIAATLILTAGAAGLEPFLMFSLGKLKGALGKASTKIAAIDVKAVVEKLENPANAAASGTGNAITTSRQGDRAAGGQTPPGAGPAVPGSGGDPLSFLSGNLEAIEKHTQDFEQAFSDRANQYNALSPEQWEQWDKAAQEKVYMDLLAELDQMALGDINKLETADTLAVKIELYMWSSWIRMHVPGVKGLQIGNKLATRLKVLGVESLAEVHFDTTSWIFMEHKPTRGTSWEGNLRNWANTWSQSITKKIG
jgi:hypothetical protein